MRHVLTWIAVWAVFLLLPLGSPAFAKLPAKEWRAAQARYKELFSAPGNLKAKARVLRTIASDGTGRAFRLLAEALFKEAELSDALQAEYAAKSRRHVALTQKGFKAGWTALEESEVKALQARLKALDELIKEEREVLLTVVSVVVAGPEALRPYILLRAKSGSEWTARAAALRVAVMTMKEKASRAYVFRTLNGDKDPRVRMVGLDTLAAAPEGYEDLVIGRLMDPDWPLVMRAAAILGERKVNEAIPALVRAVCLAPLRVAENLGEALRALTGEEHESAVAWFQWWQVHKGEFTSDVQVKEPAPHLGFTMGGHRITSDRILFIIDVSGSMKLKTENHNPMKGFKPPGAKAPPPPPELILSGPKIQVAKHELTKAIKKLPQDLMFNMISFNHGAAYWQPTMQKASAKNKESALHWVRVLKPRGSCYIDGALRMGFTLAGLLSFNKGVPNVRLDTIVLLSDGRPTDSSFPVSKLMKPEVILEHVRDWNKAKQVVIHCIGLGRVEGSEFLQKLAAENGGVYVDR